MNKICSICKKEKNVKEFYARRKKKNGTTLYYPMCKECKNKQNRKYYMQNRKKELERGEKRRKKRRAELTEYKKTLKCKHCGLAKPECLDFHHIDPNTKVERVSYLACLYSLKKALPEIEKCVVLCSNCHIKEHKRLKKEK